VKAGHFFVALARNDWASPRCGDGPARLPVPTAHGLRSTAHLRARLCFAMSDSAPEDSSPRKVATSNCFLPGNRNDSRADGPPGQLPACSSNTLPKSVPDRIEKVPVELAKLTVRCGVAAFLTDASRLGTVPRLIAAVASTCRSTLTISLVFLSRWPGRLVAGLAAYWSLLHILDEGPTEYRTVPIGLARSEPDRWPPSTGLNKSTTKRPVSCGKKCCLRPGGVDALNSEDQIEEYISL